MEQALSSQQKREELDLVKAKVAAVKEKQAALSARAEPLTEAITALSTKYDFDIAERKNELLGIEPSHESKLKNDSEYQELLEKKRVINEKLKKEEEELKAMKEMLATLLSQYQKEQEEEAKAKNTTAPSSAFGIIRTSAPKIEKPLPEVEVVKVQAAQETIVEPEPVGTENTELVLPGEKEKEENLTVTEFGSRIPQAGPVVLEPDSPKEEPLPALTEESKKEEDKIIRILDSEITLSPVTSETVIPEYAKNLMEEFERSEKEQEKLRAFHATLQPNTVKWNYVGQMIEAMQSHIDRTRSIVGTKVAGLVSDASSLEDRVEEEKALREAVEEIEASDKESQKQLVPALREKERVEETENAFNDGKAFSMKDVERAKKTYADLVRERTLLETNNAPKKYIDEAKEAIANMQEFMSELEARTGSAEDQYKWFTIGQMKPELVRKMSRIASSVFVSDFDFAYNNIGKIHENKDSSYAGDFYTMNGFYIAPEKQGGGSQPLYTIWNPSGNDKGTSLFLEQAKSRMSTMAEEYQENLLSEFEKDGYTSIMNMRKVALLAGSLEEEKIKYENKKKERVSLSFGDAQVRELSKRALAQMFKSAPKDGIEVKGLPTVFFQDGEYSMVFKLHAHKKGEVFSYTHELLMRLSTKGNKIAASLRYEDPTTTQKLARVRPPELKGDLGAIILAEIEKEYSKGKPLQMLRVEEGKLRAEFA